MTRERSSGNPGRITCLALAIGLLGGSARAQESWDAIYLAGTKIGHVHTYVEKVKAQGKEYLRVRIDMEQRIKRDRDFSVTKLTYGTIETLDGQVLRLDTLIDAGQQRIRAHGDVIRGQMELILEGGGGKQSVVIPWGPEVRGPYAAEQSMARKPMKEGEIRSLKMFMPTLNKVCDIELKAQSVEPTVMGDSTKRPLLRVDQKTSADGKQKPEFDVTLWVDPEGQVLKQEVNLLGGYVQYRTTKEAAKSKGGPMQFDLIAGSMIKVKHVLPNAEETRMVRYQLAFKDTDSAQIIPVDSRQSLQAGANKTSAILEVKSMGPTEGQAGPAEVDAQYLRPNVMVTSEDKRVKQLALQATQGVDDPWQKAVRIEDWVYKNITEKNFSVAFAAASEVARNRSGDCTEHAVLAAAMCRAVGIPSRVVIGLVYVKKQDGFGFHMWDEVYVNQRWVAIDPAWNESTVDAAHIKIAESSLDGVAPFEAVSPILRVMGKMEIDPIEFR
jgi:Transglutaminase-like superfamily